MHAVSNDAHEIVQLLLDAGANPNIVACDGSSALHQACESSVAPAVLQLLLQFGGNPNLVNDNPLLHSVLHVSNCHSPLVQQEKIQILINAGAKVDGQNSTGTTALMLAVRRGLMAIVNLLLDCGADPNVQSQSGCSAMHDACSFHYNSTEILRALLEAGGDPSAALWDKGITPLVMAYGRRFEEGVRLLLEAGADPNSTNIALHRAIHAGNARLVQSLLDIGADVSYHNDDGLDALDIASMCNKNEIAQMLVAKGSDRQRTYRQNSYWPYHKSVSPKLFFN